VHGVANDVNATDVETDGLRGSDGSGGGAAKSART